MGLIRQPKWTGLGWDFAGTVVASGRDADLAVGARVAGLARAEDEKFVRSLGADFTTEAEPG